MNLPGAAPRLLVVDDEPDLRTLYELTLMREGYDVESAGTVGEGWAALQASSYDLLITDMRLPDGTGLELLSRLEAAGRPEKAMVITAYGSPENAVEALKAGAYDYLTKPVDLRQFRAVVASALGRQAPAAAAASLAAVPKAPRREAGTTASPSLERLAGGSGAMISERMREMILGDRMATKAASTRPSAMITCAIACSRATSVPGFSCRYSSAIPESQMARGSATISLAPLWTARFISIAMMGCASVVLLPITNSRSTSRISGMLLVIAPAPNIVTRPATVGACQVAAHWWQLFVPNAARASFCIR